MYRELARSEHPADARQRSISRMLRMETDPERFVDPQWTQMEEAGKAEPYYLDLDTYEIRRSPEWYHFPQGGIL